LKPALHVFVLHLQVVVPDTYLKNPPTDPNNPDTPVSVSLNITIMTIDKINTAQMMFALTMMVSLQWTDHRLKFNNLKQGLLSLKKIEKVIC